MTAVNSPSPTPTAGTARRVVLAYSGGLDTSVAIGWIAQATGAEIVAVAIDVGQGGEDLDAIEAAVTKLGESSSKMGEAMYAAAAADQAASEGAESGQPTGDTAGDDGDVVDAEIVDDDTSSDGQSK